MALTINILYRGKGDSAKKFVEEVISSGLIEKIRSEKGSLRYEYYFPAEDKEACLLIDSWESQEDLDNHHTCPNMDRIAFLRTKYNLRIFVRKFEELEQDQQEYIRK